MTRLLFLLGVTATAGKLLVRDKRIPRPIRWVLMLTVVCLWIPGPVDEVVILLVFGLVVVFWRQPLREAWASARNQREDARAASLQRRRDAATPSDDSAYVQNRSEAYTASEPKMTLERQAIRLWKQWGEAWAMTTACFHCHDVKPCRGRRRRRMICLSCWDQGKR